ncbi:MAG: YihY/virulence factor BrkB family protein, partial [Clostridium sp.]
KLWNLLRYSIVIVVMIIIFAAIYRYTPSKRTDWSEAIPGAVFVTLGWITVSLAFSFYVNNFANYSRIYGSLATIFVLMTWLYISSIIIIIGGEINSVLGIRKDQLDIR